MKANEKLLLILFTVIGLNVSDGNAQLLKDVSLGFSGGADIYQGDLSPSGAGSLKTSSFGFNLYAQKPFNDYLAFRLNFSKGKLSGDESKYSSPVYRQHRNFMFTSSLNEFSGLLIWNIRGSNYNNYGWSPYIFSGIGVSHFRIKTDFSRLDSSYFKAENIVSDVAADVVHGTPGILPVIPVGAGFEFPVSRKLSLTAETSYRFVFSDYIDGFSLSANPDKKDSYYSVTVGLRFRLNNSGGNGRRGQGVDCPVNLY